MADLMQQARELLPCPFCGSTSIDPKGWASTDSAGPACDDCGASAGSATASLEENIEAWNRRAALRAAPEGPATHYHCAEGIYGTLSRLRRYAKQGDNKNSLQGQTMEEAAAFIEHALAARPQG